MGIAVYLLKDPPTQESIEEYADYLRMGRRRRWAGVGLLCGGLAAGVGALAWEVGMTGRNEALLWLMAAGVALPALALAHSEGQEESGLLRLLEAIPEGGQEEVDRLCERIPEARIYRGKALALGRELTRAEAMEMARWGERIGQI